MGTNLTSAVLSLAVLALAHTDASAQNSGLLPPAAHLSPHVELTGQYFAAASRLSPALLGRALDSYKQHGISALLQDDPDVRREADRVGALLGTGLRHFSEAVRKDMVLTVERNRLNAAR